MKSRIDLHAHTTASDGSLSPSELVQLARNTGLSALAITDHDTLDGIAEAQTAGASLGVEVVPGVEVSAEPTLPGHLHLIGLFVDPQDRRLEDWLAEIRFGRSRRNSKILARLQQLGIAIELEEVEAVAAGDVVARPHIAKVLLAKKVVPSIAEAFERYLARGAPAYVDRERATAGQAIEQLHRAGGLAILAHPHYCGAASPAQLEQFVIELRDQGLDGMEIFYPTMTLDDQVRLASLARRTGLLASGGSDFHGDIRPGLCLGTGYGSLRVPYSLLEAMHAARDSRT